MHGLSSPLCSSRRAQRGLSLVELMVGIVVSLLVGLAAAGSAMMFTASQRQGIGAGGASINSVNVMNGIKADVSLAGLGFFNESASLCQTINLSVANTVVSDAAPAAPLQATTNGNHDTLDLQYASLIEAGTSVLTDKVSDGTSVEVSSLLPANVGQAVLLSPEVGPGLCLVRTVTTVTPSTPTAAQKLDFAAAGSHNDGIFTTPGSFPKRSRVSLLGDVRWNRYRVDANEQLLFERPATGGSAVLMRNVVVFRVQYGVSASAASTTLDSWVDAKGAFATITAANIDRVRALRIGVVVRSPQREKADAAGNCVASTTQPSLFGTTPDAFPDPVWKCYRYRTSTVIVPLRNYVM